MSVRQTLRYARCSRTSYQLGRRRRRGGDHRGPLRVVHLGQSLAVNFTPGHTPVVISTDISNVPYFAARSLLRMLIALGLSTVFTLVYGTAAARLRRAEKVLVPDCRRERVLPGLRAHACHLVRFRTGERPSRVRSSRGEPRSPGDRGVDTPSAAHQLGRRDGAVAHGGAHQCRARTRDGSGLEGRSPRHSARRGQRTG